jgi:hypothetical protein
MGDFANLIATGLLATVQTSASEALAAAAAARAQAAGERAARGAGNTMTYYPPVQPENRYQASPPSIGEAPAHIKFMSPRCSALHDALRTAAARGLAAETMTKMRRDYPGECAENETEARGRLQQELREKNDEKRQAESSQLQQRNRTTLQQEQCGESKRILVTKRARTDLTEGERAELQRFEANYRARCS